MAQEQKNGQEQDLNQLRKVRREKLAELQERGEDCQLAEIERDIQERDHRDMTREIAPLKQAEDALLIDSSDMTIEEVVASIRKAYEEVKNA